jgi:putative SOS response-associated peptidase YedK
MCGRYRQTSPFQTLAELFGISESDAGIPAGIAGPGMKLPVIREGRLELLHWGYVPHWSKDGHKSINARSETIAEKPSFRDSFALRRCLVPANGFYEWDKSKRPPLPYDLHYSDDHAFAMAGLWDEWKNPETGEVKEGFVIITTPAIKTIAYIHDRMPAILTRREEWNLWLDPTTPAQTLKKLLRPNDSGLLFATPAEGLNKPANEDFPESSGQLPLL